MCIVYYFLKLYVSKSTLNLVSRRRLQTIWRMYITGDDLNLEVKLTPFGYLSGSQQL